MKAMDLDYEMLWDAAKLMEQQGGGFAACIAQAFYRADSTNRERLLTAFDDLFVKFYKQHRIAEMRKEEME
jgi:2-oxo-4-hydroxy-4-carboxy--5-ureidoimidazoline (OHCU) decarboxylase